jgi:hypothetical protein
MKSTLENFTPTGCRRVVVGVADSEPGREALRAGIRFAGSLGVELHLVRVWQDVDWLLSATATETQHLRERENAERALLEGAMELANALDPTIRVVPEFIAGNIFADLPLSLKRTDLLTLGAPEDPSSGTPMAQWFARHTSASVVQVDRLGDITLTSADGSST